MLVAQNVKITRIMFVVREKMYNSVIRLYKFLVQYIL